MSIPLRNAPTIAVSGVVRRQLAGHPPKAKPQFCDGGFPSSRKKWRGYFFLLEVSTLSEFSPNILSPTTNHLAHRSPGYSKIFSK